MKPRGGIFGAALLAGLLAWSQAGSRAATPVNPEPFGLNGGFTVIFTMDTATFTLPHQRDDDNYASVGAASDVLPGIGALTWAIHSFFRRHVLRGTARLRVAA